MSGLRVVEGGRVVAGTGPVAPVRWLSHRDAALRLRVSETRLREMRAAFRAEHDGRGVERFIGARGFRIATDDLERLGQWWHEQMQQTRRTA